jgi:hypothetical protein
MEAQGKRLQGVSQDVDPSGGVTIRADDEQYLQTPLGPLRRASTALIFIEQGLRLQSKSAVPKISLILLVNSSPRPPREFDAYPIFSSSKLLKALSGIDSPSSLYCDSVDIACHPVICTSPL